MFLQRSTYLRLRERRDRSSYVHENTRRVSASVAQRASLSVAVPPGRWAWQKCRKITERTLRYTKDGTPKVLYDAKHLPPFH
jgi:hypothetical protein